MIPARLRHAVSGAEGGEEWLTALPDPVARAVQRWQLVVGRPFEDGMAAWAAPARAADGAAAVLKISLPQVWRTWNTFGSGPD